MAGAMAGAGGEPARARPDRALSSASRVPLRPSCGPPAPPWRPAALANLPFSPASRYPRAPPMLSCAPRTRQRTSRSPSASTVARFLCCTVLGAYATADREGHMAFLDPFPPGATVGGMRSSSSPASRGAASTRHSRRRRRVLHLRHHPFSTLV